MENELKRHHLRLYHQRFTPPKGCKLELQFLMFIRKKHALILLNTSLNMLFLLQYGGKNTYHLGLSGCSCCRWSATIHAGAVGYVSLLFLFCTRRNLDVYIYISNEKKAIKNNIPRVRDANCHLRL